MKEYKLKSGNLLRIDNDDNAESPDDWLYTESFLVYDHRQFDVRREGFRPTDIHNHLTNKPEHEDFEEYNNSTYNDYYIFPVEAYIHSEVSLSLFTGTKYCQWDSSVTGFILIKKTSINSVEGFEDLELATVQAENLIIEWNQYLQGNVYEYKVIKFIKTYTINEEDLDNIIDIESEGFELILPSEFKEKAKVVYDEEIIDSCGGYYADNTDDALEMILNDIEEELETNIN